MKKNYFILTVFVIFTFISCKNKVTPENVSKPTNDSTLVKLVDTAALIQKAKEDMVKLTKPYNEHEDAQAKIDELVAKAKKEGKYVFIQAGGNWCIWCLRFTDFVSKNTSIKSLFNEKFITYHLNYSKDNKNESVFDKYAPKGKELGFPFFIILNESGEVIDIVSSDSVAANGTDDVYYDEAKTKSLIDKYMPK